MVRNTALMRSSTHSTRRPSREIATSNCDASRRAVGRRADRCARRGQPRRAATRAVCTRPRGPLRYASRRPVREIDGREYGPRARRRGSAAAAANRRARRGRGPCRTRRRRRPWPPRGRRAPPRGGIRASPVRMRVLRGAPRSSGAKRVQSGRPDLDPTTRDPANADRTRSGCVRLALAAGAVHLPPDVAAVLVDDVGDAMLAHAMEVVHAPRELPSVSSAARRYRALSSSRLRISLLSWFSAMSPWPPLGIDSGRSQRRYPTGGFSSAAGQPHTRRAWRFLAVAGRHGLPAWRRRSAAIAAQRRALRRTS